MNENVQLAQKYFKFLKRRQGLCALLCVALTSAIVAVGYALPKKYSADSTVFIEENIIKNLVKGIAVTTDVDSDVRVLKDALLSRNLINQTVKKLDPVLVNKGQEPTNEYIAGLQSRTVIGVKGKDLFKVSIIDPDPKFAQEYINTLVRTYVNENLFSKREETYGANRFFDEQIKLFKKKLDEAENAIVEFRKQHRTYVSLNESSVLADLRKLTSDLEGISSEIENLKAKRAAVETQLKSINQMLEVGTSYQTPARDGDRLRELQDRLSSLMLTYTESYPEVIKTRAEIEEEKKRLASAHVPVPKPEAILTLNPIYVESKQRLMEIESEISSRESMERRIRGLVAQKEELLRDLPENQKQLNVLEQERDSAKKIYQDLLGRMGQAEVSKQMELGDKTTSFRVIDPAIFPVHPVSPNMILIILGALAAGIASSLFLTVAWEDFSGTVGNARELGEFKTEVLGVIPLMTNPAEERRSKMRTLLLLGGLGLYYLGLFGLLAYEVRKIL